MDSKKLILPMLFGFALVCSTNLLCFFPQTVLHTPPEVYRLYNLTTSLSIVGGSLIWVFFSLLKTKRPEKALLPLGYSSLAIGMSLFFFVGDGSSELLVIATGIASGLGIGLLMVCWFSFLAFIPERYAMLTQGGQALLGSLIFVFVSQAFPNFSFAAAIVCLAISAILAAIVYRKSPVFPEEATFQASLIQNLKTLSTKGSIGTSFTVSLFAFVVISLLYGTITAVIMSPLSDINALEQATWGGIIGASIFLVWAFFSKRRDYGFVIKAFFGVLAFVLILPLEGHGMVTAVGYQLICLLFFSLVIDTFSSSKQTLLSILSLSYALTRGLYLAGLYVPGQFGVLSYEDFFASASLLFFLVYLVFIVLLFILNREKKRTLGNFQKEDPLVEKASSENSFPKEQNQPPEHKPGEDILSASLSVGKKNALTKREIEVLGYLARGRDVAFICQELYLSRNTVKSYTKAIYAKLDIHSRQELIDAIDQEARFLAEVSSN